MKHENTKPAAESVSAGFPEALREFAAQAGITQRQIAETIGVSLRTVEEWCAGRHEPQPYVQALITEKLQSSYVPKPEPDNRDSVDLICEQIAKIERTEHDDGDQYAAMLQDGKWVFFQGMNGILRRFIFDNRYCKYTEVNYTGQTVYLREKS